MKKHPDLIYVLTGLGDQFPRETSTRPRTDLWTRYSFEYDLRSGHIRCPSHLTSLTGFHVVYVPRISNPAAQCYTTKVAPSFHRGSGGSCSRHGSTVSSQFGFRGLNNQQPSNPMPPRDSDVGKAVRTDNTGSIPAEHPSGGLKTPSTSQGFFGYRAVGSLGGV